MTAKITDLATLRKTVQDWRDAEEVVALVPTMGALHEGHLALVAEAKLHADRVIVSIFVNPTQFGPNEDFDKYPRPVEADLKKLAAAGADAAWVPSVETMYPNGPAINVSIDSAFTKVMDGQARPGHFDGVATVVATLFEQVQPDTAIFGQKDYQQLMLIKRLVEQQRMDIEIIGMPTQREADGLALSSRNQYLSKHERTVAPALHDALRKAARGLTSGRKVKDILRSQKETLTERGFNVEYFELRHPQTLETMYEYKKPGRLFVAARLGTTRLIDNIAVE